MHLFNRTAPRWVVLIIDMVLCTFSVYLSYDLRFNFSIPETEVKMMPLAFGSLLTVRLISFLISRTYTGIIRYTSYKDSQRIFITLAGGTLLLFVINLIAFRIAGKYVAPYSILMIDFLISMLAMSAMRVIVKSAYMEWTHKTDNRTDVLIMGAGEEGLVVKHAIEQDAGINFRVLGLLTKILSCESEN